MELDKIEEKDLKMGKANQDVFSETLQALAETDRNIIAVTSDSRGSGKLVPFGEKYPNQIVEVGIAEQNLVGVAAGLASAGKKTFAVSPACFLSARALEQIKNDVCYSDNPVTLVGISSGVSYGALGTTHHSLHDYAVLRAINNIIIVAPADNFETEQAVRLAAKTNKPVYMRYGKKAMPFLKEDNKTFEFGKGRVVREGNDITIIATGETVYPAWLAAKKLEDEHDMKATVVSMHTIKPLDIKLLEELASNGRPIITVEEHMVNGGLGEACASHLFQKGFKNPFKIVGIPDEYTVTGSQVEIFNHYGISKDGLFKTCKELLDI
ncbi:transketolase C-terminal domain-containing protein [Mariniflexile litorale]|uniref:Transketolase C-terminal domain-containing protein n=1 Tax=Mariniflexile litorale TaxID=3045158 RepID=A0AAU7EFI0_9FLAO|nr:transketolase C-terminal domain-containing protein [Mariniflexile sp. KMM 9835]MDQ8211718.1 transketolase C-terminal domain-containing protein [Mariniflexile sp. KMM 9835]